MRLSTIFCGQLKITLTARCFRSASVTTSTLKRLSRNSMPAAASSASTRPSKAIRNSTNLSVLFTPSQLAIKIP
ncbi:hypothetical protein L596_015443 [Steinernema carpocapsae]|uniref:Uncharacterized protein n=1 Tax=Steinernema carpocapsae TaxID=34508 RepID=A0A4U5NEZ6_STECR|nr:hypothetical protein L596_015443 [Steinernema carpocapsae]